MKTARLFTLIAILCLFMAGTFTAYGQRERRSRMNLAERYTKIMEDAGCPLSDSQIEDLKELRPGRQMREKLNEIFTEKQQKILLDLDHKRRISSMIRTLDNSENPLSDEQKKKIEGIEPGSKSRIEMMKILTDEQKEALKVAEKNRRGRGQRGNFNERLAQILKDAGCPLTEEQQKKMSEIQPGPESRDAFRKILTDEQRKALEGAFQRR